MRVGLWTKLLIIIKCYIELIRLSTTKSKGIGLTAIPKLFFKS